MGKLIFLLCCCLFSFVSFSQTEELFQMKRPITKDLKINKLFTSDSQISISDILSISSLSITGKIKLVDYTSLVRIILIAKEHEYLVLEAFPLICDNLEFSFNKYCDESFLINDETPKELIIVVRNAEIELKNIHFSEIKLNTIEESNFHSNKAETKELMEKNKASKINVNNGKKNKTWLAGTTDISLLSFEKKKNFFGGNYDFLTDGFDYYTDGIFSFETFDPTKNQYLKSVLTSTYPASFDWRNRHGQNWMTSIKLQGACGSCWAFTAVAATEIMTNLYFNQHLNLDLSEQDVLSCSNAGSCVGGSTYYAMIYIQNYGVCDEDCFPYTASDQPCSNKCASPTEEVSFASIYSVGSSGSSKKNALIFHGPMGAEICEYGWCHAMALIGYNTIQVGDTIRRIVNSVWTDVTIQSGDPIVGQTYWIFKNSYLSGHAGYHYIFFNNVATELSIAGAINTPITSLNYSENNRICADNDHDGYYWWGIGSKPTNCLSCVPDTPDGDDSNPNLGPLDAYGNCIAITSPYSFPDHEITTSETWQSTTNECGNIIIKNTGNLTINGATINLEGNATFSVEIGGILTFNSGVIQ